MKKLLKTVLMSVMAAALTVGMLGLPQYAKAAGVDSLTDAQKNSSYGFFVWLSENADTADEREDAKVAAQILSNTIDSAYSSEVFNDGTVVISSKVPYTDLLGAVELGAENDATSLEYVREAIAYISLGNEYRAKESLPALKVSSGLMAMAELSADYQLRGQYGHPGTFLCLENLASCNGYGGYSGYDPHDNDSYDPYTGWYTEEKENYDTNNGDETGHYETLTDRNGGMKMLTTGFGLIREYTSYSYEHYYAQEFSDKQMMYTIGSGNTPEEYLDYLDEYECTEIGHDYKDVDGTAVESTCTTEGKEADKECSRCGDKVIGQTLPMKEHAFSEWEIIDPATYDAAGLKRRECIDCNAVENAEIPMLVRTDISKAAVSGISSKVYTGKAVTVPLKLSVAGKALEEGTDYEVAYSNNTNAGTARITITGKGDYKGAVTKTFTIAKAAQKMTVKAAVKNVKYKKLKKKKQIVSKVFTVKNARGTVSYKTVKFANSKAKKALSLNRKNGKITVKKGTKKGKYKMTVAVTARGDGNFKAATKKVTVTVRVK